MVENISIEKRVSTLHECLIQQAQAHPDRQLFSFLAKGGNVEEVSYGQLHEAALSIGVYLQVNCESGSRILIHCPNDFSFVKAFWGCLYAGMIAVPVQEIQRAATASHFLSIADDAKPAMVLTTPSGRNKLEACLLSQKEPTTLPGPWTITSLDQIPQLSNATVSLQPSTEDIAYLQYTSGSTARPKGVVIKHQNVLANIAAINERGQHGPEDRIVSWLPFFHDMGLVYGVLLPVVLDVPTVILKPLAFLRQPLHWLATISRHQATHTVAPNFAYDLCVQKVDSQNPPTLDLSCLKIASVGAEPVRAETLARFSEAFASAGFDPTVFSPSYGLAENTLMVSVLAMDQNPLHFSVDRNSLGQGIWKEVEPGSANSQILMACGRPSKQTEIVRVHPEKETLCGEDEIGEIWLRSPSVGVGYWQNPAGSKEKFGAYLKEDGRGPYLRTGDLGIIKNDQVIITGRLKDLLIFRGRNYYPNDIESAVQEMDASLRPASCAAFSVRVDGEEQLVLVRVVRRLKRTSEEARQKLVRQIRSCISEHFQLRAHSIVLAESAAFPRTSSGKVQRTACKQKFLEGKWDRAFVYEMRQEMAEMETSAQDAFSDVGKILCTCISSALSIPLKKLDPSVSLLSLGMDSLGAVELSQKLRQQFGVDIPLSDLFAFPTLQSLIDLVENSEGQREASQETKTAKDLIPGQPTDAFPLTNVQQAYWFGTNKGITLGNVSARIYLELATHEIDVLQLSQAWNQLIQRHEMLRAVVLPDGTQKVLPSVGLYQVRNHLLSDDSVTTSLASLRERMLYEPKDLQQWPLFELALSTDQQGRQRLHISLELLIADLSSVRILMNELQLVYKNQQHEFPLLLTSFRQHVLSSAQREQSVAYRKAKEYWLGRLSQLTGPPELPMQCPPAAITAPRFGQRKWKCPTAVLTQLKAKARARGLTLSSVLMTAFGEVLLHWGQSNSFTLNLTLFANRTETDKNRLVGDFTSLLLLQMDMDGQATFWANARKAQDQLMQDMTHRSYGGVEVLRELTKAQTGQQASLMPVVFTSHLSETDENAFAPGFGPLLFSLNPTPQVWLSLQVYQLEGEVYLSLEFVEQLFAAAIIDDMFSALLALLQRLAEEEDAFDQVQGESMTPPEQIRLREDINHPTGTLPKDDESLLTFFRQSAQVHPNATAIICPDRELTYAQLDEKRRRLSETLWQTGLRHGQRVGVILPKSWEAVNAILSIYSLGAVFVPLDPNWPEARLKLILESVEASHILTSGRFHRSNSWLGKLGTVIQADAEALEMHPLPELDRVASIRSTDVAYIIFTSGSTGTPKGVVIEHRAALNTVLDINHRFGMQPKDRCLAISSLCFDLSVYDVFAPLSTGAALVMPSPSAQHDPQHWLALIQQHEVSIWNSVPALAQMLTTAVGGLSQSLPSSLRLFLLSGDWIPVDLPDQIRALAAGATIISLGGATEASIWSIFHPIDSVQPEWTSIPYGRPLAHQAFHVLDRNLRPCPNGVAGQLYISGVGLAKEYWKSEQKTNAAFFVHPESGERLYKTGDWGRYDAQGVIEFLGRRDKQVKINGFRVEIAEIENHLKKAEGVEHAIVLVQKDERQHRSLHAFVEFHPTSNSRLEDVKKYLATQLPPYLLPAKFHAVDQWPLTSNGKIDQKTLLACDTPSETTNHPALPQATNAKERALAQIISDILGRTKIGMNQRLFEIGITSIDLVTIQRELDQRMGHQLPIASFFQYPSIRELANHLGKQAAPSRDRKRLQERAAKRKRLVKKVYVKKNNPKS